MSFLTRKKECSGAWRRRERAGLGGEVGKGRKRRGEEKEKRKRVLFLLFRLRAIVRTYVCVYACMRAPSRRESVCYGEAVTHPAREGEGERDEDERERERASPVPVAGSSEWGRGSIYRLEKRSCR